MLLLWFTSTSLSVPVTQEGNSQLRSSESTTSQTTDASSSTLSKSGTEDPATSVRILLWYLIIFNSLKFQTSYGLSSISSTTQSSISSTSTSISFALSTSGFVFETTSSITSTLSTTASTSYYTSDSSRFRTFSNLSTTTSSIPHSSLSSIDTTTYPTSSKTYSITKSIPIFSTNDPVGVNPTTSYTSHASSSSSIDKSQSSSDIYSSISALTPSTSSFALTSPSTSSLLISQPITSSRLSSHAEEPPSTAPQSVLSTETSLAVSTLPIISSYVYPPTLSMEVNSVGSMFYGFPVVETGLSGRLTTTFSVPAITSTLTQAPSAFSTLLSTNSLWSVNTVITTTGSDNQPTVLPVLVGFSGCAGCGM